MLAVPALFFLFLKGFGKNKYALQVFNPMTADCPPSVVDSVHRIPPFSFTDQTGKPFTDKDLDGKVFVSDYFFTRCPSICLDMSASLARVQDTFKGNKDLKLLSHTVDPEHDSVPVLQEYAQRYAADPEMWTFVTGAKQSLYEHARCGYFIVAKEDENKPIDFIHSPKMVLVDKQKRIRGYYDGTDREDVDRLITEIQVLFQEED